MMGDSQATPPQDDEPRHTTSRRQWLASAAALGACGSAGLLGWRLARAQDMGDAQVVQVTARRFAYTPSDIVVRAGVPIVLEVTAMDFAHGMNFPDLGVRADLMPGKVVRVTLPAQPEGIVEFLCDNFCGDDHENMHGRLVVQA